MGGERLKGTSNNLNFCPSSRRMIFENRSVYGIHEDRRKLSNAEIGQKGTLRGALEIKLLI